MDCEDKCGEKAYLQLIKTNPQAKLMDEFITTLQNGGDDTKEEAFQKIDAIFSAIERCK